MVLEICFENVINIFQEYISICGMSHNFISLYHVWFISLQVVDRRMTKELHGACTKGGLTLGSTLNKFRVQNTHEWTSLLDSRLDPHLKFGLTDWVECFLELGLMRFGKKRMPH